MIEWAFRLCAAGTQYWPRLLRYCRCLIYFLNIIVYLRRLRYDSLRDERLLYVYTCCKQWLK